MLLIRRTLWQRHSSPSASTISGLLRSYHLPSAATVRLTPNLTDDLAPLRALKPLAVNRLPPTSYHSLLLLATPLFAPSLSHDRQWLIAILNRLYSAVPELEFNLRVGVAVVDALPPPKQLSQEHRLVSLNPPLPRSGFDGLAYLFGDSNLFKSFSPAGSNGNKTATISLALQNPRQDKSYAYEVHVPLANTTFAVGHNTVSMVVDFKKSTGQLFREISSVDAQNITVSWPYPIHSGGRYDGSVVLSAPLLPLTIPRKILAGMGNVVRQISGSETNSSAVPASSELEAAITSFFKTTCLPQSPISVWALVTPVEMHESYKANIPLHSRGSPESLQTLWRSSASVSDSDFLPLLEQGARLCRVLSGGGGWGQKAGLLALDPFTHVDGDESDQPSHFPNDPDSTSFGEAILGDAARVGDYIQFFISHAEGAKVEPDFDHVQSRLWSLHVGTIPSTIDQLPTERKPSEEAESNHDEYFPNHFGVLSEKGLSIRISPIEPWAQQTLASNRSKVDVPFSLLAAQQLCSIFTYHLSPPNPTSRSKEQREDDGSSSRKRQIQSLRTLIQNAERRLMSYAKIAADTLQYQSSGARSKFSQFFKIAGIWCDKKLYWTSSPRWRKKSHEDLWKMINSAMQLEIEARRPSQALYRLKRQVLASERWITQLKSWLSKKSYVEKALKIKRKKKTPRLKFRKVKVGKEFETSRLKVRKVIEPLKIKKELGAPMLKIKKQLVTSRLKVRNELETPRPKVGKLIRRLESKPDYHSIPRPISRQPESSVNEDALADKAWDAVNKNHLQLAKKFMQIRDQRMLAEENRTVADQVAKLLDGFQP